MYDITKITDEDLRCKIGFMTLLIARDSWSMFSKKVDSEELLLSFLSERERRELLSCLIDAACAPPKSKRI